jgi:hypothetical protein
LKNIQTKGPAKNWKLEGFQRCLEEKKKRDGLGFSEMRKVRKRNSFQEIRVLKMVIIIWIRNIQIESWANKGVRILVRFENEKEILWRM